MPVLPRRASTALVTAALLGLCGCGERATLSVREGSGPQPALPPPRDTVLPTVDIAPAVGWPAGTAPIPAPGLAVGAFATGLDHPRWLAVMPNGDVLVAETNAPPRPQDSAGIKGWIADRIMARAGATVPSADRITLLRDTNGDGVADLRSVLLDHLHSPFGMARVGDTLYVANTDAVMAFPYRVGQTRITASGRTLVDLPAGPRNHHWTKNLLASPDGHTLYVTIGSNSNVAENGLEAEQGRARIIAVDLASGQSRPFATGLRNPNGMAWQPVTGALWVAVNERDEIGSDLVPDYMTHVRDGGFYGWPWSYYGQHVDTRVQPTDTAKVAAAIAPDYALGPHTASLGLAFYTSGVLPGRYDGGAFIGQHGSWNRKPISGYKVVFVPFAEGQPRGLPEDVLTGFVDAKGRARGRPVGVAIDDRGALLVADDVGNTVWRVTAAK
ncbi:sorbosone dehydrogenase family protein [Dyella sp.]|uniref:PQQ-dependent sugar dehydrogenase n=1 Tax=Dyella sp. TaxID=1869338 RepID=UPI002D7671B7|nr:sorbosone dehydrogenase family protein [Dyella sp.]HET6433181.1 sorbosone dehydrogenase family protein [Dyella sp.]